MFHIGAGGVGRAVSNKATDKILINCNFASLKAAGNMLNLGMLLHAGQYKLIDYGCDNGRFFGVRQLIGNCQPHFAFQPRNRRQSWNKQLKKVLV
jgi:hypothetical protein